MMKNVMMIVCLGTIFLFADTKCVSVDTKTIKVNWEAYKTLAKIGVKGTFDDVALITRNTKEVRDIAKLLSGLAVTINPEKVNSNNRIRDEKLVNRFFKIMNDGNVIAKVTSVKTNNESEGTVNVAITMNSITQEIPMRYLYKKGLIKAVGYIDLFDFNATKALREINDACFDLHAGKTWNDVAIGFELQVNNVMCRTNNKDYK